MKDHVQIDHLTKYDVFRVNRDQVMGLEIWLKIHTNVSKAAFTRQTKVGKLKLVCVNGIKTVGNHVSI